MNSLLNDLSVVARDEAGKFQINPVRFDIDLFLDELVRDTTNMLNPSPVIIINNTVRDFMVSMDKELVRYIFTNLLSNAVKFTPSDQQIIVSLTDAPDHGIILQIRDHGIGIAPQDLPAIFEPFHRGQNVAGYSGTGLGLSIVKRCVDLHKGNITIESALGKGTVVTAVLPQLLN
jgi:signal transduction histidine kinase